MNIHWMSDNVCQYLGILVDIEFSSECNQYVIPETEFHSPQSFSVTLSHIHPFEVQSLKIP